MNVSPRRIDTHAHIVPDFYRDWLATKGIDAGGLPVPFWSVEAALDIMGKTGVETAILSVSTPGVEPGDVNETRAMARRLNVYSAAIVAAHPGRFGFFATLTLPDVEGALAEAAYAFDSLKADGVVLHAHAKGIYLGDPAFDPLMEELNRRKAVIFVHPSELPGGAVPGIPAYVADFLLDSVRAAVNLTTKGVMNRCPDIKVILSHAGGFLPYAATRIAGAISPGKLPVEAMRRCGASIWIPRCRAPTPRCRRLAFADRPHHLRLGLSHAGRRWRAPFSPQARCLRPARQSPRHQPAMPSFCFPAWRLCGPD